MEVDLAQSLGGRGRVLHVHDQKDALFDLATVIVSGHEGQDTFSPWRLFTSNRKLTTKVAPKQVPNPADAQFTIRL